MPCWGGGMEIAARNSGKHEVVNTATNAVQGRGSTVVHKTPVTITIKPLYDWQGG